MRFLGIVLAAVVATSGLIGYAQNTPRRPAERIDPSPPSSMPLPHTYAHCLEPDYMRMRRVRMRLAGMPETAGYRLRQECAAAAPK